MRTLRPLLSVALALGLAACAARDAAARPRLRFSPEGTFKVMQLTDVHHQPELGPSAAASWAAFLGGLLEAERPDLVVLTGDFVYWSRRPVAEYLDPVLQPIIDRAIPWAATLGNHDQEYWYTARDVMAYLAEKPCSTCSEGPAALGGGGNYALEVLAARSERPAAVLYMLDTGSRHERSVDCSLPTTEVAAQLRQTEAKPVYRVLRRKYGERALRAYHAIERLTEPQMVQALKAGLELTVPAEQSPAFSITVTRHDFVPIDRVEVGYDYLSREQVRWYRRTSFRYRPAHAPALPALMFFHIPLQEHALIQSYVGAWDEPVSPQKVNTGLFQALLDQGDVMGVFVGHDHVNDYVGLHQGVALGYGRKSGRAVYGPPPEALGARVFVLHEGERRFDTWLRTATGQVEDQVTVPDDL